MVEIFDISKYKHLPELDLGIEIGSTSYIDFIEWDQVTSPVMWGLDVYRRAFIVIKMKIKNRLIMQTFFQRYIDGKLWMGCGHATQHLISTDGGMDCDQIQLLYDIIDGKNPKLYVKHRPYKYSECRKIIELYDEIKIKAVNIIKKQWLKCRYDPSYKMCETVLLNNLKELHDEYNKKF
jgi:hypothetical protein